MKAIQIAAYGKPTDVARYVDVPDVGSPGANEVVIEVEASPINQYDLLMISGGYGYSPELPLIVGTEGAGRVVAVGSGVKHLKEGDRTLVPFLHPAWAQRIKTDALWLRALPPGDVNQFAMMGVNPPTAYLLLTDIVKLPRGSWVIQNGANSGVGRAVIAIAKSLGLKTVNIVRRSEVIADVKELGGDVVLLDGADLAKRVAAETGEAPIHLALDGVADASPMNMMACLSNAGTLVSYGGTSRKPMAVHPGSLIFKQQTVRGFWLYFWYKSAKPEQITEMFDHLGPLVAAGTIATPVAATFGLDNVARAIAKAGESGGKVLFTPNN
ncbi:MAG TPA: zinc-dependent alcohol dehydrogenase family protein [Afipia sp.]